MCVDILWQRTWRDLSRSLQKALVLTGQGSRAVQTHLLVVCFVVLWKRPVCENIKGDIIALQEIQEICIAPGVVCALCISCALPQMSQSSYCSQDLTSYLCSCSVDTGAFKFFLPSRQVPERSLWGTHQQSLSSVYHLTFSNGLGDDQTNLYWVCRTSCAAN